MPLPIGAGQSPTPGAKSCRQLSLLERMIKRNDLYPKLDPMELQRAMDTAIGQALARIETFAEPAKNEGGRRQV